MLCDSRSAVFAACAVNTPTQLLALSGTCSVIGESYNGGDANIAVQASGSGASITWTSVGLSKILTSGDELPAVQADTGGSIEITGGAIQTSGAGAPAVLSEGGSSSVTLSGGASILTEDAGSAGLAVSGSGALLTAIGSGTSAGVIVKTEGVGSIGATNGFGPGLEPGGTMDLTKRQSTLQVKTRMRWP